MKGELVAGKKKLPNKSVKRLISDFKDSAVQKVDKNHEVSSKDIFE